MIQPLYQNRTVLLLIGGQGISVLGNGLYSIALMWYVMERTGSSLNLGISVICMTLPAVIFMAPAGVWADKNIKKPLLFLTDIIRGLIMVVLVIATSQDAPLIVIYIGLAVASTATAFFSPAFSAAIPLVVPEEQLPKANAAFQFINRFSSIIGPAIGGMLIALTSEPFLFAINALTFFVSAIFTLFVTIPDVPKTVGQKFFRSFAEGLRFTIQMRRLLFLILVGGVIINFFLAPLDVYLTIICNERLKVGSTGLGWVDASVSIGALAGSLVIMGGFFKNQIKLAIYGLCLEGIALIIAGLFMSYGALIVYAGLLGIGVSVASVGIGTTYQKIIDKDKMGRVMSLSSMLSSSTVPLGTLVGSLAVIHWSMTTVFIVSGVMVGLSGLSLFIPFRNEFLHGRHEKLVG
ncbi:MFS transporter [Camelliibacillus cellulosilyticus]|uniref:MFS transporter n=1 Tax=Camelliibacillus cellulosilyticus TaxID=2174486 RepID=A0ABV9GSR1_9BACL